MSPARRAALEAAIDECNEGITRHPGTVKAGWLAARAEEWTAELTAEVIA